MPTCTYELNCFLSTEESRLSNVVLKELELASKQDYSALRYALSATESLWYAHGKSIYLIGDGLHLSD